MPYTRRQFIKTGLLAATVPLLPRAFAQPRQPWLSEGVVGATALNALTYILRRGGESVDAVAEWHAQRSEETILKLKKLGVNLITVNLHKGAGLKAERDDIETTRAFTALAHKHGLKVGGYVGGSMLYEAFFKEEPGARDWRQVDEFGRPLYFYEQTYRYMACRNNPGYMAYLKKVLRLGVQELGLDLIHLDQLMCWGEPLSCRCPCCRKQFRQFLARRYADPARARLRFGFAGFEEVIPPPFNLPGPPVRFGELNNPLMQEWSLFRAASLARQWEEIVRFVRHLNPQTALLGNAPMNQEDNVGFTYGVDLGQLLQCGDAVWSEEDNSARWTTDGRLVSQIRSYKAARAMGQTLFVWQNSNGLKGYQKSPHILGMAEALAFNDAGLGVVAGEDEGCNDPPEEIRQYIRFFWSHIAELRHTTPVTDAGVLRSFASTQFNPSQSLFSTVLFEQTLIQFRVPFGIVFERQLRDLSRYKVLVLADQDALSDEQVAQIRQFVAGGGGLVVTESTSLLTGWRTRRSRPALADLYGNDRVIYLPRIEAAAPAPAAQMNYSIPNALWKLPHNANALVAAVKQAAGGKLSAEVEAPAWVVAELADQPATGTRLLHLINYKHQEPLRNIPVKVRLPQGARFRKAVVETLNGPTQELLVTVEGDTVSFRVPELEVYDLVLLRTERRGTHS